ncbi:MAG: type I restriction-modification system subunit M [Candidatus Bathyarchaeota archaeon]|nr:type I restriction-modification system subunit M [Candidatus Bathyarchaeota archaeon]
MSDIDFSLTPVGAKRIKKKADRVSRSEITRVQPVQDKLGAQQDENRELEKTLWGAADKLRSNMDAAEYKHVVLGLIFLKYVSDSFNRVYEKLQREEFADPEHPDEYRAENVFWVPKDARWGTLQKRAKEHEVIGRLIDQSMDAIERDNPKLRGVLPRNYARPELDKQRLGELIDLISGISFGKSREHGLDLLGRVYEYFIGMFADAEGKKGGQFYTPRSIVRLLVEMIEPFEGRVFDPCCGSGGMFIQSKTFVEAHKGRFDAISVYGQESNPTTWRLCKMNLAIRGIEGDIRREDSFTNDLHKDLKADFILANPPFNDSDWRGDQLRDDARWQYGIPPTSNANFAWIQHFIHHLAPHGVSGFVLANGSLSSMQSGEGEIRKAIIEADLVDCILALPSKLFYNTPIEACLWFIARDKTNNKLRNRSGETLFIDARNMGTMIDRRHRDLTNEDIHQISDTYHSWRGELETRYKDIEGYCKSANIQEIRDKKHRLTPGRYVGIKQNNDEEEPYEEKIEQQITELLRIFENSKNLEEEIKKNFEEIGFEN